MSINSEQNSQNIQKGLLLIVSNAYRGEIHYDLDKKERDKVFYRALS